jgi:hypothetical protein
MKRIVCREVVFSACNAKGATYITYREFIRATVLWGIPRVVKRFSNTQFQVIVKVI